MSVNNPVLTNAATVAYTLLNLPEDTEFDLILSSMIHKETQNFIYRMKISLYYSNYDNRSHNVKRIQLNLQWTNHII